MKRATTRRMRDRIAAAVQEARKLSAIMEGLTRARRMGLLRFPWDADGKVKP
jgi:hypothetical protein